MLELHRLTNRIEGEDEMAVEEEGSIMTFPLNVRLA